MNVEIGAEAALFPEKEYMNAIAVAVQGWTAARRYATAESRVAVKTTGTLQTSKPAGTLSTVL